MTLATDIFGLVRVTIAILCVIGLFVSVRMLRKFAAKRHGELPEPSVVSSPRAQLAGVPNALVGAIYYVALLVSTPLLTNDHVVVLYAALAAAVLAATVSIYLAYSLLFVTRMPCVNCWIGHIVNWLLVVLLGLLVIEDGAAQ